MKAYPWLFCILLCGQGFSQSTPINRQAVVRRHTIHINKADSLSSLSVGNGQFAFTVDVTGLQSFPQYYAKGVPLGTQSEWGWHSFPDTVGYKREEALKNYHLEGKDITYLVQVKTPEHNKQACDYFRVNPHRLQLGHVGLVILKKNGQPAGIEDIQNIDQQLDMWTGQVKSRFTVEGQPVEVITYAHQQQDAIAVKVTSPLIAMHHLGISIHFPYPTGEFKDVGVSDAQEEKHSSRIERQDGTGALVSHTLDTTTYYVQAAWNSGFIEKLKPHTFLMVPENDKTPFEVVVRFSPSAAKAMLPSFTATQTSSANEWARFWKSGGAVDFSGSTNPKAMELERRIVTSQYLLKIQESSAFPPQETGLTYNSWFGKPHLEMIWWHAVHYALWGRPEYLEKVLGWYRSVAGIAYGIAKRQGFEGLRWQKMTDHSGEESPSSVGAFLIWQQPHFIYMTELCYRAANDKKILDRYKDLVFATADFMASFAHYDSSTKKYNLGKGLIPAQECFDAVTTFNPTYELAYWYWALNVAQQWRQRLGLARNRKWDEVLQNLAPLPQANGVYLATESTPDCYTTERYKTDHPAVLAAYATIPRSIRMDTAVMKRTFDLVWKVWKWDDTWGWDFPLTAMTATRLQLPQKAIDALFMPVHTNTYLMNGHNYQDERLTIYLPGNGGLLSAVAMMCAGYDGCSISNPGFPKDGTWKVKWEGLKKIF